MTAVRTALAAGPLVLDGGLGTLLEARGHDLGSTLWSARLLLEAPGAVRAAHREFVDAGADVVTTASYQVSYEALAATGLSAHDVDGLLRRSVELAREAGEEAGRSVLVAASVGPYGAAAADGSEYTGAYGLSVPRLRAWHRRRLATLADAGADLLAIETLPSPVEIEAVCLELDGLGVDAWVSASGASTGFTPESLGSALRDAASAPGVVAVGVNCCPPAAVGPALTAIRADVSYVVYPNSGERWDATARRWHGTPGLPDPLVGEWLAGGARLVGGCCRTMPSDISRLAALLASGPPSLPRVVERAQRVET